MSQTPTSSVVLKPGKEKPLLAKHHWIFSGAVQSYPKNLIDGDLYAVSSASGVHLGFAYWNRRCSIAGRMVSFDATPPQEAIQKRMENALQLRKIALSFSETNAYRLINGEGDGLPGLIVDVYDRVAVMQISTLGMAKLKPFVLEKLKDFLLFDAIYEKSELPSRREEGLENEVGIRWGQLPPSLVVRENGLQFAVDVVQGQKTGFFLDQREMRLLVKQWAHGRHVVNAFGYSGGFSVYALAGGAKDVLTVDISSHATALAKHNLELNGYSSEKNGCVEEDVFTFLRRKDWKADFMILDPPAFAKKQKDIIAACKGYKDINRLAMQNMPAGSLLLSCSCSHFVEEALFQKVLFQAACEAKKEARILRRHHLAADHPVNLHHPEGNYLKSFLLYLE